MTTLPARVAEAWRDEAARWQMYLSPVVYDEWIVFEMTAPEHVGCRGSEAACRAWLDEQCGRAAARVVVEALELPTPVVLEAGNAALLGDEPKKWVARDVWGDMLAAFRREMGT